MGYHTNFSGELSVTPPLNEFEQAYLEDFADLQHTSSSHGLLDVSAGMNADGNSPQGGKPDIWCHWIADEAGDLVWDEREKTYSHPEWLEWLIDNILGPQAQDFVATRLSEDERLQHFTCNHVVNGEVDAQGEDSDDMWRIKVVDNEVRIQHAEIVYVD